MGAVTRIALAAFMAAVPPAAQAADSIVATRLADWQPDIVEASRRFGIPKDWIEHVIEAESGSRTIWQGRPVTSRAGAMGLMQLMPATWAEMRAAYGLGVDPYDPHDNIIAGTAYLRRMYDRFGYPGLFAAYNAGPTRYAADLASGRPLPDETRVYVARVTVAHARSAWRAGASLFVSIHEDQEMLALVAAAHGESGALFSIPAPR